MKKIVAGNWKMNLGLKDSVDLAASIIDGVDEKCPVEVWIAPSTQALAVVSERTHESAVQVGGQNVHWEKVGAFTGEVSVTMLRECGCSFALTGHSERRHILGETEAIVTRRTLASLAQHFTTVLCIGETLAEREANETEAVLRSQLQGTVAGMLADQSDFLVIAYEPVWAIGTGKVASRDEIADAHAFIADFLGVNLPGSEIPILYGGSVSPDNFEEIIQVPNVSGALVGGASLSAEKFLKLVTIAQSFG